MSETERHEIVREALRTGTVDSREHTLALRDEIANQRAVIDRLLGDPIPWHPSLSHREWFRTTFVDGDQREPMTEPEAAVLIAVYGRRADAEAES